MLGFKKKNINFIIYFALLAFFGIIIIMSLLKRFNKIEGYTDSANAVASNQVDSSNVKQLSLAKSPGQF
jgi:hypothetical protein